MAYLDWIDSFFESHQGNEVHYLTDVRRKEVEEHERQRRGGY